MKVLVTGRGTSGSWKIRGVQLGAAIGASVVPNAVDMSGFDVAIAVKRTPAELIRRITRADVPFAWDVVDAWTQPAGNEWSEAACKDWLAGHVDGLQPAGIVAATRRMAEDCGGFGLPVLWLPHHARPGQKVNMIRAEVRTVGYEGGEAYLGRWRAVLDRECERRGWRFIVNPEQLADLDIVVALREASGYAPRHWKSGVKLVNAQATGTPFIGNRECGYLETAKGGECWADDSKELVAAFDRLTSRDERRSASSQLLASAFTLEQAAAMYKPWLASLNA